MNKTLGILLTSRNNYSMLDSWKKQVDTKDYPLLNIDEDSTPDQKNIGKTICNNHNITYMDREERGMQFNVLTGCNYFEKQNKEWMLWCAHDIFPLTENFFDKLQEYINNPKMNQFGVIGFNILHDNNEIREWDGDNTPLHHVGRSPLQPGDNYYRNVRYWPNTRVRFDEKWKDPFAVESIKWDICLINIQQYKKHIVPTSEYHFFHAWDDISFQFLYNNVYNICLPQFCCAHRQEHKVEHGLPRSSPNGNAQVREQIYGKWGHLDIWKKRWGFAWDYPMSRQDFENVKDNYKDTLIYDFAHHDPINGPLKSFDI